MRKTIMAAWLGSLVSLTVAAGAQPAENLAQATSPEPSHASHTVLAPVAPEAGEQQITFSEFPRDTAISNQYLSKGILFGGNRPFITTDRANPTSPVLSGTPLFFGAIEGSFVKQGQADQEAAVGSFSLDAGYFNNIQSVRVSLFDGQGRLIRRASNARLGIRTFTFDDFGVSRWRIEAIGSEPAGFAIDNVRFPRPYRAIFAGIRGAPKLGDVIDDPDSVVSVWKDEAIAGLVSSNVGFCRTNVCLPRTEEHLKKIGASALGGVVSLGFFMTSVAGASSLNTPGNSEVPKNFIVNNYKPGDRVYLVGFSAGGGDAQNVLEKLDRLNIPVQVSGHIDSVEIGNDATIPDNTRLAKGYHQKQSSILVRGEDKLKAANPSVTTVTNTKIADPVGPDDAEDDANNHHRNMDNDPRVWNNIRAAIIASLKMTEAGAAEAGCPSCQDPAASHRATERVAVLAAALEAQASGEELYDIRERMAQSVDDAETYRELLAEHERASSDLTLQENLTAVFLKVNPAGFLAEVEAAAEEATDYPLFAAMMQSLARVENPEAKKAVIRLIANNRLEVPPGQVIDAAVSAYSDGAVAAAEAGWMLDWVRGTALTDRQLYAIARIMANTPAQPEVRSLLEEVAVQIQDERLKAKVKAIETN